MMRIISVNLNGIRAASRKGFYEWLEKQEADVVCLQETKAQMEHLDDEIFRPKGYHSYFADALKKGYSGVGIYSKIKPTRVQDALGWPLADEEGRYVRADFNNLSIVSLYLPSGSSGEERQQNKFKFMDYYERVLNDYIKEDNPVIICGDWNIVHQRIDIKNFTSNQKNSGCLPEERAWLDKLLTEYDYVDAFREVNKEADQYTWWSNRGQAWANNVGWRIDYQMLTPQLRGKVKAASIYKDERFSDHAPLIIDYDYNITG